LSRGVPRENHQNNNECEYGCCREGRRRRRSHFLNLLKWKKVAGGGECREMVVDICGYIGE
jgi:hypothetical protein